MWGTPHSCWSLSLKETWTSAICPSAHTQPACSMMVSQICIACNLMKMFMYICHVCITFLVFTWCIECIVCLIIITRCLIFPGHEVLYLSEPGLVTGLQGQVGQGGDSHDQLALATSIRFHESKNLKEYVVAVGLRGMTRRHRTQHCTWQQILTFVVFQQEILLCICADLIEIALFLLPGVT